MNLRNLLSGLGLSFLLYSSESTLRFSYGHEAVHAMQYRSFGTAEIGLRAISSYPLP